MCSCKWLVTSISWLMTRYKWLLTTCRWLVTSCEWLVTSSKWLVAKWLTTVKTANFRQKKGLNRGVESQWVSQFLIWVDRFVSRFRQLLSFCYKVPNFWFLIFTYWFCTISVSKFVGCIKAIIFDNFPPQIYTFIPSHILPKYNLHEFILMYISW